MSEKQYILSYDLVWALIISISMLIFLALIIGAVQGNWRVSIEGPIVASVVYPAFGLLYLYFKKRTISSWQRAYFVLRASLFALPMVIVVLWFIYLIQTSRG